MAIQTKNDDKQQDDEMTITDKKSSIDTMKDHPVLSYMMCAFGIVFFYSVYAFQQENLLADKSKNLNIFLVLGIQAFVAIIISSTIVKVFGMGSLSDMNRSDINVGFVAFATQSMSNYSLKFVNYPFMVLAKSAKVIPIVLCGWFKGTYKLKYSQMFLSFTITAGLIIFNSKKVKNLQDESVIGILLVIGSLMCDGLQACFQDEHHKTTKRDFAYQTMCYNNIIQFLLNGIFYWNSVVTEGDDCLQRMIKDSDLMWDVLVCSISGALGQIFIYLTISVFNGYKVAIFTTARKCFSVVFSNIYFQHNFSSEQWLGAVIVMASCIFEVFMGKDKKKTD